MYFYRGVNTTSRKVLNAGLAMMNEDRGPGESNKRGPTFVEGSLDTAIGYARNKQDENNAEIVLRVEINNDNFLQWQPYLFKVKYPHQGDIFLPDLIFSQGDIVVTNKEIIPITDFNNLQGEIQIAMSFLPQELEDEIYVAILDNTNEVKFTRFGELRDKPNELKLK